MAVYRHTTAQINEYFEHIGINQSALKVLIKDGIQAFLDQKDTLQRQKDLAYEEKRHFLIGSGADVKITQTEQEFEEQYFVSTLIKKPGDKAMLVLKKAYELAKEAYPDGPDSDVLLYKLQLFIASNEADYYMNWGKGKTYENDDSRVKALLKENGAAYWTDLCVADGKQILSDDESTAINNIVMSWKTHKFTSWLFEERSDIDTIYQMPLYFTIEDVDCKVMVDQIRIDHSKKRIFDIDFKTLGDYIIKFPWAVDYRRYDIQGAFYSEGTRLNLQAISELIGKDVKDYTIANFAFVGESTIRPGTPLIWLLKQDMMDRGKNGGVAKSGYRYPGYLEALAKFKQWQDIDFSLAKRFEGANGVVLLGTDYDMNINI